MPRRARAPGLPLLLMLATAVAVAATPADPPMMMTMSWTKQSLQCLQQKFNFLQESHKERVCDGETTPGRRRAALRAVRLRYCTEHRVLQALPERALRDAPTCRVHLQELLETDVLAWQASCTHTDLLRRYDCAQNYSIAFSCEYCKIAYRRWICSELVPFYGSKGGRVPPCLRLCEDVEQQCPYLLPDQTLTPTEAAHPTPQYAGEPAFLCLDSKIPRLEYRTNATTGDEDCCYTHCGTPGRGSATTGYQQPPPYCNVNSTGDEPFYCQQCPPSHRHDLPPPPPETTSNATYGGAKEPPAPPPSSDAVSSGAARTRKNLNCFLLFRWTVILWTLARLLITLLNDFLKLGINNIDALVHRTVDQCC